ncbi:MAG: hypothetical protein JW812_02145 [Alphaproteobacteria bacterium]|nr:hypothetical protein [Alphaproteobacteria bacterium]MBN2779572.1 hypothetical protein [Alphaproteobacteria bacterium]
MLNLRFLCFTLFLIPLISFAQPMEVDVSLQPETFPSEDIVVENPVESAVQETIEAPSLSGNIEEVAIDESEIPYEDFSQHSQEQPTAEARVEANPMTLESAITTPVTTHPLLSLETTGSIFDQFAEFEKNKMLMDLQTEEQKMELERDRIKLQRLKLAKELAQYGDVSLNAKEASQTTSEEASHYVPPEPTSYAQEEEVVRTFRDMYSIKTIMGVGKKLIAVLVNNDNDTKTRVKVGTEVDGYTIRKIQPKKGITIEKDGETEEIEIQ